MVSTERVGGGVPLQSVVLQTGNTVVDGRNATVQVGHLIAQIGDIASGGAQVVADRDFAGIRVAVGLAESRGIRFIHLLQVHGISCFSTGSDVGQLTIIVCSPKRHRVITVVGGSDAQCNAVVGIDFDVHAPGGRVISFDLDVIAVGGIAITSDTNSRAC
ncbi:hypothetical protein D3C76_1039770 [compost metagenome]